MSPTHSEPSNEDLSDPLDDELAETSEESNPTPPREFAVDDSSVGQRLDQFLTARLPSISRARVQQWIDQNCVLVRSDDRSPRAMKASGKLRAGEIVTVVGDPTLPPLRAEPEDIPLNIVYEDPHFAVINKPAGMMVHAGSGATDSARNRGTLVNALLHHMATLSATGDPLRPGIVHRLDKQTSGLIVVAKDDATHRRLSKMFADREVHKTYIALVHGAVKLEHGTLDAPISRDQQRRTRMTTHRVGGRTAVSHYRVLERFQSRYGHFTLVEVEIETGRTHQIRVHLSSIGHPVVGDTLYGAPQKILPFLEAPATRRQKEAALEQAISVNRNFLHAMRLRLPHPESGKSMEFETPLPEDLEGWLTRLRSPVQQK
ncbi:MAG TPA: RluA family pseudouridine synthase [Acidobacteriaceae bacterium]|nr:RluA family pseudouridine synthase [Acidobacteriaceae bacterium]